MGHCISGAETSWFQTVIKQIRGNLYCGEETIAKPASCLALPVWLQTGLWRSVQEHFSYTMLLLWLQEDSQVRRQAPIQQKFKHLHSFEHVSNPIEVNEATLNA